MWSTLVLNMHARYFVLNCGSNWHSLIRRLRSSCGASPATVFCLNSQHPQAPFFVCDQKWQHSTSSSGQFAEVFERRTHTQFCVTIRLSTYKSPPCLFLTA